MMGLNETHSEGFSEHIKALLVIYTIIEYKFYVFDTL